jgi:putative FmdB family regulatory protein
MPVYTYRCENCGVQFDRHQKFSDPPLTRCPECNKKALKKVIAPVGIVFKGSGFYATDHRSPSGGGSRSGSEKAGKQGKTDKADANGESKPSAPETSKPASAG